jgi:adenylate cyclase
LSDSPTRKLATIVALDVAGYSARTETDEAKSTSEVAALRKVIEGIAARRGGRIFNTAGDGFMLEFGSSLAAVEAALELADTCDPKVRVGVHLGDVVVQPNGDLLGHGVNVAARLMAKSDPGSALVSADVRHTIRGPLTERLVSRGALKLEKMAETVEAFALAGTDEPNEDSAVKRILPPQSKPSIAVLPFANLSNDPEHAYFTDGMMQEITTAMSRIRAIFVIASASAQSLADRALSPQAIGRQLGVNYVLEGKVRRADNRVRVAVTLIDATDGAQVWSDRYDDTLDDVFALQDRVAVSVAGVIEPTVREAEIRRAMRRPTTNVGAYDLYLRALALIDTYEKDNVFAGLKLLDRAIAADPNYATAMSLAAYGHAQVVISRWSNDLEPHRAAALAHAKRAVQIAPDDADVLSWVTGAYLPLGEDNDASIALIDRSIALNPGSCQSWMMSGWLRLAIGESARAIEHFETAMRLDPCSSDRGYHIGGIAFSRFQQGRFEETIRLLKEAIQLQPAVTMNLAVLVSSYGHLGQIDAARATLAKYKSASPIDIRERLNLFRAPAHRALFLDGIDLAEGKTPTT